MSEYALDYSPIMQGIGTINNAVNNTATQYNNFQEQAIQREEADRKRKLFEEEQKPINLADVEKTIPSHLRKPMMELMQSEGIIEQSGDVKFLRKGAYAEFKKGFNNNDIQKAMVHQQAIEGILQTKAPMTKEYEQIAPQIQSKEEYYNYLESQAVIKDEKSGKVIPDYRKLEQLKKKRQEETSNDPMYKRYSEIQEQLGQLTQSQFQSEQAMGIIDEGFKNDAKTYGDELALRMRWDKEFRKQYIIQTKAQEAYEKKRAEAEAQLPYKMELEREREEGRKERQEDRQAFMRGMQEDRQANKEQSSKADPKETAKEKKESVLATVKALDDFAKINYKPKDRAYMNEIEKIKRGLKDGSIQPEWVKFPEQGNDGTWTGGNNLSQKTQAPKKESWRNYK